MGEHDLPPTRPATRIAARIHDAVGPLWTRLVLPAIACATIASDVVRTEPGGDGPRAGLMLGAALLLLAGPLLGRHRSRRCTLVLEDGAIDVEGAGLLDQRIRARDLTGASATRAPDGDVTLALGSTQRGDHPILLELPDERAADRMRDALGVGHHGFGRLTWSLGAGTADSAIRGARIAVALPLVLYVAYRIVVEAPGTGAPWPEGLILAVLAPVAILLMAAARARPRTLTMDKRGIHFPTDGGRLVIPFADVVEIAAYPRLLALQLTRREGPVTIPVDDARHRRAGLSELERRHVVDQISAASHRARGVGPSAPDRASVDALLPRPGESVDLWLARLEALGRLLESGANVSYRGGVTEAEMWAVLEDADAPPVARVGAARVLSCGLGPPRVQPRVRGTLARIHDDALLDAIDAATSGGATRTRIALDALGTAPPGPRVQVELEGPPAADDARDAGDDTDASNDADASDDGDEAPRSARRRYVAERGGARA